MYVGSIRRSFKDSLKVLEADIQHANTINLCSFRELFNLVSGILIF
ncbi:hypothetical protein Hdeb2414_s0148g00814081 [Helianthus debilis subsp. tardiflorus]